MNKATAVGLGEVLWDVLEGAGEGAGGGDRTLGGAPANFAFHVNGLGGAGVPVSRVGRDDLGREAVDLLRANGLDTACVTVDPQHATGTVLAQLDGRGQATYVFPPDVAWDFLELNRAARDLAKRADAVSFGTLAQRSEVSRAAIHEFLRAVPAACLKVFDVNLRQDFYSRDILEQSLDAAHVLKVSDTELPVLAGMFGASGDDRSVLEAFVSRFGLKLAALTRGAAGSLLVAPGEASEHAGLRVEVVDTIGAGDAFGAALTLGLLAGWDLDRVNARANEVAARVCAQQGAMVEAPVGLRIIG